MAIKKVRVRHNQEILDVVKSIGDISLGHLQMIDRIAKSIVEVKQAGGSYPFERLIKAAVNKKGDMIITIPKGSYPTD